MEQEQVIERVKKFIEKVLEKADLADTKVEIEYSQGQDVVVFNLRSPGPANLLIGQNGENLRSLQYIVRLLVRRHLDEVGQFPFILDINGYRQQKDHAIYELVDQAAKEVKADRKLVLLRPMNSYERRLAHTRLAEDEGVVTESVGEGEERKVVVKPATGLDD